MNRWRSAVSALSLMVVLASCQGPTGGGTNVALLYGVSEYDPLSPAATGNNLTVNLQFPAQDVEALAPLLSTHSGGIYSVLARTDANASRANMKSDIIQAASQLGPDSLFLFYYGGHGQQGTVNGLGVDAHAYILPFGSYSAHQSPTVNPAEVVTEDELHSWLAVLPTKRVIVILDACFSGGFIAGVDADGVPQDTQEYYKTLWKAFLAGQAPQAGADLSSWFQATTTDQNAALTSWKKALVASSGFAADQAQLLTAAGALEESYDSDAAHGFQHGAFTYFLLQAKDHGDIDGNGYVTVSEAYRYAFDGIQTRWNGVWGAVGYKEFLSNPGSAFLPHLSPGPADHILFKK